MTQTTVGVLSIVAVITSPVVALLVQRWTENRREKRQLRLWVFRTLMMHRATPLAYDYVQSLNLIDVVFNASSKKEAGVRRAWKVLLDHLNTNRDKPDFGDKTRDLTAALLSAMGACLGYDLDEVYLKKHAYQPEGHGVVEEEQHALRKLQLQLLKGDRRLPIALFPDNFPPLLPAKDLPDAIRDLRVE